MSNRRPAPDLIAARKWEIKRRYEQKLKVGRRSRGMAAIRLSELTRWLDDVYGAGVELELEPNSRSETILRVFAHHLGGLPDAPRRITAWIDKYSPWLSLRSREILIREVVTCPIKWSADKLAWKLGLTDAKRTELKIKTIGAIDCNHDQRKARDKAKRAERERNRRKTKRLAKAVPYI
jgi:hypothetical protein